MTDNRPRTLQFNLPSDFAASHEAQRQIMEAVDYFGYGPLPRFAIQLALEEAIVNAIKHGNRYDEKKRVHVGAIVKPDQIEISVEDEGPGFTREVVPDPRAEENLCKCSGRGILLIECYMNSVSWSNHGRRIIMVRRNDDVDCPRECAASATKQ